MSTDHKAMFIGHFLGDALGLPYEWRRNTSLYTGKLDVPMRRIGMYGNVTELDCGQVSDDSEMTIILARHIVNNNFKIHKENLILSYIEWANHRTCFGMGKNTRQLFKGIKTYKGYLSRFESNEKISQSNGAMMRCSALTLITDEDEMMKYAELDCSITNPNPICINVNKVYLKILRNSLLKKPKEIIINEAHIICLYDSVKLAFEEGLASKIRDVKSNKGWCLHGLYCVVYCLINFDKYSEAIEWVIKQGGDTDTNACIVGAVYGAYLGMDNLLKEQHENINILLNCNTKGGNKERPSIVIPKNFIEYIF